MNDPAAGYIRIRGRYTAHFLTAAGTALCGAAPQAGRQWRVSEGQRDCSWCLRRAAFLARVAAYDGPPDRAGIVARLDRGTTRRIPVGECASCGRLKYIRGRGLCPGCIHSARKAGTLQQFGWVRTDRLTEYRSLRAGGLTVHEAADRTGVSHRTGWRYEQALTSAGQATWKAAA